MSNIFIYDEFSPEDTAMLQALYSRSPQSVEEHVKKVKESGSGKFMEQFYIGYGHQSIADCGSTTLFIENLSILADKSIQDWQLYSGQETSTRYVDMSKQEIIDPIKSTQSKEILDRWMKFYIKSQDELEEHIKKIYPKKEDEKEEIYNKAVKSRCFDVMRGFLPAGITTQLSWHTNLRQAWDKLSLLKHHPLAESREIAMNMLTKLKEKYPHSFSHKEYDDQENYYEISSQQYNYYNPENPPEKFTASSTIKTEDLEQYKDIIESRPQKTNLPTFLAELGSITFEFMLDFGSWRDIQRHRNGVCRNPLLNTNFGFNHWYLEQLSPTLKAEAEKLISEQIDLISKLKTDNFTKQYYISLGFNMPSKVTYGLPAAVYVTELRSGKTVHPSLRKITHQMNNALTEKFPTLKLHSDTEEDSWSVRRGNQDIQEIKK